MKMILCYILFLILLAGCRQPYEPPAITAPNHFLVVEGVINTSPGSKTFLSLSRTRNLTDTFLTNPEKGAGLRIESSGGAFYNLKEIRNGLYSSDNLTLNQNESYRLRIFAVTGNEYLSEYVAAKKTPAIDSLPWQREKDVTIYVTTHDPQNKARHYRWDFTETWQYRSIFETDMGVNGGLIYYRDSSNQIYNCWKEFNSTEILLASSVKLSEDVIDHMPVTVIKESSERLGVRYSILVRQYALTEEGYQYWEILQKNTQKLGSLFDAQPSQLKSNIKNVNQPAEPVIGYLSACNIEEKRIFIKNSEVFPWVGLSPSKACSAFDTIPVNPANYLAYNYTDTTYAPYFFCCSGGGLVVAKKECLDCLRRGGSNQKPAFW